MSDILDNELVRKYFGCEFVGGQEICTKQGYCDDTRAYRVLRAMQEPIRIGDKVIEISVVRNLYESQAPSDMSDYHPWTLRLPDRFQESNKPDKRCECGDVHKCAGSFQAGKECNCKQPPCQVHEKRDICGCGEPDKLGICHRYGLPCFVEIKPQPKECEGCSPNTKLDCGCGCHSPGCTNEGERGACCPEKPQPSPGEKDYSKCDGNVHVFTPPNAIKCQCGVMDSGRKPERCKCGCECNGCCHPKILKPDEPMEEIMKRMGELGKAAGEKLWTTAIEAKIKELESYGLTNNVDFKPKLIEILRKLAREGK